MSLSSATIFHFHREKFLKLIKFITQSYLSLSNLFPFLSTFSVFLNGYFLTWFACKVYSEQIFSVNKLYYVILQSFFLYPAVSHIFNGPGSSGSESKVQVQVLEVTQLQCVYFLTLKKKKCENKSKVHQVHIVNHYTIIKQTLKKILKHD